MNPVVFVHSGKLGNATTVVFNFMEGFFKAFLTGLDLRFKIS